MKKQVKKLSLSREMLRDLDEGKLAKVYGASLVRSLCVA